MSLKKILFNQPKDFREFIEDLRREKPSERKVTIYNDFVSGKIKLSAIKNHRRIFLIVYKSSRNSPYKSREKEIEVRAEEYKLILEQEGFSVDFYW
jgi:hypothetical protein